MMAMNFCTREPTVSMQLLSMPDLRAKLFPRDHKNESALRTTEEKYGSKVLEGNWFERRAKVVSVTNDWSTTYETHYKPHSDKDLTNDRTELQNMKRIYQGLAAETLFDHHESAYRRNMSTTYDLSYRVLPQSLPSRQIRTFNSRRNEWVPVQDYMQDYGNVTESGLTEYMKWKWSVELESPLPWRTSYQVEYRKKNIPVTSERFPRRSVNMNQPDLRHLAAQSPSYFSCLVPYKLQEPLVHETHVECTRN